MMDEKVESAIRENKGFVVILAGSDSDVTHVNGLSEALRKYQLPHQVRIYSAHKQPPDLVKTIIAYDKIPGTLAYIAVAGGTDALSGTASFRSSHPVISCPPDAPNDTCTKNPPGSSNAYIPKPQNAARFIAQMFSGLPDTPYRKILEEEITRKIISLETADARFSKYPYESQPEVKK
ncbi:MAG TPA: AIR carboxylase family protein [Candidatus Nanoarchaeia archaeon]|nr:AIR carboxylase family protein [Candidatus Nanoarchaeia archaeon]